VGGSGPLAAIESALSEPIPFRVSLGAGIGRKLTAHPINTLFVSICAGSVRIVVGQDRFKAFALGAVN
jgi:hypothetical protein